MKYEKRSLFNKGEVIPEDAPQSETVKIPETLDDERELLQDQIEELHKEARNTIQSIIDKVVKVTGQQPYPDDDFPNTYQASGLRQMDYDLGRLGAWAQTNNPDFRAFRRWTDKRIRFMRQGCKDKGRL